MGLFKIFLFSLLSFGLFLSPAFCNSRIIIGSDASPPLSSPDQTGMLDLIVKEAFSRIGEKVSIRALPSERSLVNANQGFIDGDLVRIEGIDNLYPNLVRVPEKTCDFEFTAFGKDTAIELGGWESLEPYSVGIIIGWKILEENVHSRVLVKVENPKLLFNLIKHDRVDMVIYNRHEGYGVIKEMDLQGIDVIGQPLESREMFLYLNKKHGNLIPPLARAMKDMKKDGTYSHIVNAALKKYLP